MRFVKTFRAIEYTCWLAAVICFVLFFSYQYRAHAVTQAAKENLTLVTKNQPAAFSAVSELVGQLGLLSIERLNVQAVVFNGTAEPQLDIGVGRVPGTSYFELPGNVAIAGHRDSFFRNLQHVQVGDVIAIDSPEGQFHYDVTASFVVEPNNVSILRDEPVDTLTLITCYPFNFVGNAPQRFIVKARKRVQ